MRNHGRVFRADASSRYLPWVLGLATFLATLSFAALLALDRTLDRWDETTPGVITVQIAPSDHPGTDALRARALQLKLRAEPGVEEAELLSVDQVVGLLAPWLGGTASAKELPLPRVLHVRLRDGSLAETKHITEVIQATAEGAVVDDHRIWRARLVNYTAWLRGGLALQLALVLTVTGLTAVFLTLSRMTIHREAVTLLHQLGADDGFIASGLVRQSAISAAVAAVLGFALAGSFLLALGQASADMDDAFMPVLRLQSTDWIWLTAVPVGLIGLTVIVASMTAKQRLQRLL
jgi:cell division transport system permease protein